MKAPIAGFSQDGLARLFGVKPKPAKADHRVGEIAGPICGVVGFALLAGLAWHVRKQWLRMRSNRVEATFEKGGSDSHENVAGAAHTLDG